MISDFYGWTFIINLYEHWTLMLRILLLFYEFVGDFGCKVTEHDFTPELSGFKCPAILTPEFRNK